MTVFSLDKSLKLVAIVRNFNFWKSKVLARVVLNIHLEVLVMSNVIFVEDIIKNIKLVWKLLRSILGSHNYGEPFWIARSHWSLIVICHLKSLDPSLLGKVVFLSLLLLSICS